MVALPETRIPLARALGERAASGRAYHEFLRVPAMSLGVYHLPKGGVDGQRPHGEDEAYLVVKGRARFTCEGRTVEAREGDLLYVPARAEHRFHDIEEDIDLLVLFAPAEGPKP